MHISVWEKESFYAPCDLVIAGSGFTGLWSAYFLKKLQPDLRITIIERGIIPTGASTRNAGFACYGSATELLYDAKVLGEDRMLSLVEMRYRGIERIQDVMGHEAIDYENNGGYELTNAVDLSEEINWLNKLLQPIFKDDAIYKYADEKIADFGFKGIDHLIYTVPESQLHSGKLCLKLLQLVQTMGVVVLPATEITHFESSGNAVKIFTRSYSIAASKLLICTNAFAKQLLPELDIVPARGQVLVTAPIPSLKIKGTFHYDEGFYYFRNLGNRLLLGGARNFATDEEATTEMDISAKIQGRLEEFIGDHLLPGISFQVTDRWSGIMGMGSEKMPIVKKISNNIFCAVRMSGMGVALAPIVGEQVAEMVVG